MNKISVGEILKIIFQIKPPSWIYENFLIDELHLNGGVDEDWLRLTSMSFEKTSTIGRKD